MVSSLEIIALLYRWIHFHTLQMILRVRFCSSLSSFVLFYLFVQLIFVSSSSAQPQQGIARSHRIAIICGVTVGSVAFATIIVSMLLWWRHRRNQQIFFDVNGNALFISARFCFRSNSI